MRLSPQELIDNATRPHIPDHSDLYPSIVACIEKRSERFNLHAQPAIFFLVLLMMFSLGGIVYAIGQSLGYIPGIGLVDQSDSLRGLAEPISITRDGITLTIDQAVLSTDKTIVLFTIENAPEEVYTLGSSELGCNPPPYIRLPDNSILEIRSGSVTFNQYRFVFQSISTEVKQLSLVIPCVSGTNQDPAQSDWEIILPLVPISDVDVEEVLDISEPVATNNRENDKLINQEPFQLNRVIDTEDGYIFLLTFTDMIQSDESRITAFSSEVNVSDAAGKFVYVSQADDIDLHDLTTPLQTAWAYKVLSDSQNWPLSFELQTEETQTLTSNISFTFDTGPNPQPGQEWILNKNIRVGDYILHVISVQFNGSPEGTSYNFIFETMPDVKGLSIAIKDATPIGGGGGIDTQGNGSARLVFSGAAPVGKLQVLIKSLTFTRPGPTYSIVWQPDEISEIYGSLYGISPVLDHYVVHGEDYYLVGHFGCTDERIAQVFEAEPMSAYDQDGTKLHFEKVENSEAQSVFEDLTENQWVYRIPMNSFTGPVSLRLSKARIVFEQPIQFSFDLSPYDFSFVDDQVNIPWKIGKNPLPVPDLGADVYQITYIRNGEFHGFRIGLDVDPRLIMLDFDFAAGVTNAQDSVRNNDPYFENQYEMKFVDVLTDGLISFPVTIVAYSATITGVWQSEVMIK
jgi:hypothetical protein